MYNPHNLHQCEQEKKYHPRKLADTAMTVVGVAASFSSVPQILKILDTGVVAGISLATQLFALFTVLTWFLYGIYIKNTPLVITSGISSVVLATVSALILFY